MKISKKTKYITVFSAAITLFVCLIFAVYLKLLPFCVSNPGTIEYIQKMVKESTGADLVIENPVLTTHFSPDLEFCVEKVYMSKEKQKLLDLNKFKLEVSLRKILFRNIVIKKLVARSIFVDVNGLEKLAPKPEKKKEQKNDWSFEVIDALLGVRECEIIYALNPETIIKLNGHRVGVNNAEKVKRNVYFQLFAKIFKKDKCVTLELKDNGRVYFKDKKFHIDNCPLSINNSNIFINLTADKKQNFDILLYSDNFNINDIIDFLNTQIVENNIQESLVYFNDLKGSADFKLNIKNNDINGKFELNKLSFKLKDVDNVPIILTKGVVDLTSKEVKLSGFEGYYDNNLQNKLDFEGTVKDYLNTMDSDIIGNARVRNDFFKKHLSKMAGVNLEIKGEAPTRIMLKSKNNIMDLVWLFMLKPGENIKVENDYLPFEDSLRLMESDMHFENMVLDIKALDYHMIPASELPDKNAPRKKIDKKDKPQPIFRMSSSIDIAKNNFIKYVSFEFPKPMPSEMLNAVLRQEIFKKGKIEGKLYIDNSGKFPVLSGKMSMDRVLVPSQMTFIKEAVLTADGNMIHLNALGGYRRAKFRFNGDVLNEIRFPIIVKDVNLSLEDIDALKVLEVFNNQNAAEDVITTDEGVISVNNSSEEFDIRNLIIEKCHFHLDKGSYKNIAFGNLDADLTLNKDGVIDIKSNRFDFAEGQSSLRTKLDLVNKKYNVKLGVLNVNSDILAEALLNLKREISGRAGGFLDLTTDDSMKLSGSIKFKVKNGTIEKIGLVEYLLKCASLFRNTISMINPLTVADIVTVPEGNFDNITGTIILKNNIATKINIKTSSPQLSNFIAGRYNIDNGDTSLRIYTKFSNANKGVFGFLRKVSLSSLASRMPMSSKNDENYYAVELSELPEIDADEKDCQVFLTKVEGDVVNNNYISSLKKIK